MAPRPGLGPNVNGQKFKVVMPVDFSNGADAIVAENSIKSIADLKGKKVAYPFSSIDNLLVVFSLNKVGLKEMDIQSVDTTPENVPSALLGEAVAGATYEPTIGKMLKLGCVYIYPATIYPATSDAVEANVWFWARQSKIASKLEQAIETFLIAWLSNSWPFGTVTLNGEKILFTTS